MDCGRSDEVAGVREVVVCDMLNDDLACEGVDPFYNEDTESDVLKGKAIEVNFALVVEVLDNDGPDGVEHGQVSQLPEGDKDACLWVDWYGIYERSHLPLRYI